MNDIEKLLAIEEIKKLKAKYFYYLDHKMWDQWQAEVWTEASALHVPEILAEPVTGSENIARWTAENFGEVVATHYGHMPIIDITSETTATGIWAMEDILRWENPSRLGFKHVHGYGHYHEEYVKTAVGWRIKSTRLTRLHVERE